MNDPRDYDESSDVTRDVERDDVTGKPLQDDENKTPDFPEVDEDQEDPGKWDNQPRSDSGAQNEEADGDPGFSGVADTTRFGDSRGSE